MAVLPPVSLPSWLPPTDVLATVLEVSGHGLLLQPVYERPDEHGDPVDFAIVHLNPVGRHMLKMPAEASGSLLRHYPHMRAAGIFDFYGAVLKQRAAGHYDVRYQHDGLDLHLHLSAQRSGKTRPAGLRCKARYR